MGILLGLLTAVCWGGGDFFARFAARRIGALRTLFYMQAVGFVLLTIFLPWLGGWGHLADGSGWKPWAWGFAAGILNVASTLALYRSFEIGKMAVVAPISASYPALTLTLSLMTGERLSIARLAGIVCVLAGVALVARGEPASSDGNEPGNRRGIGWALCSGLGFGVMFWILGIRIVPIVGSVPTVWMIRLTGVLLAVPAILFLSRRAQTPRENVSGWIFGIGVLDTSAFVLNNRGMQMEQVSVVSVLASLYGAVTVALAALFLRERISRMQWLGIAAIFAGIYLISR